MTLSPPQRADDRLNIVLLMTDQHRPDCVSFLPGSRVDTPHLDELAGSVAFAHCVTPNPICTPARCALLTGRYTRQVGMLDMSGDLDPQVPTYPRALQRAGYRTIGIGKFHWWQGWPWGTPAGRGHDLVAADEITRRYGWDEVWEVAGKQLACQNDCRYIEHLRGKGLAEAYRQFVSRCGPNNDDAAKCAHDSAPWPFDEADHVDVVTGDRIVHAIDTVATDRPFMLFGSFCSPHPPFDPPQRYLDMIPEQHDDDFVPGAGGTLVPDVRRRMLRIRRAYLALVRLVDDQVGRVLDALRHRGLLERTVVLFCSDHGEMLGDHGRVQKATWQDASAHVPAAIRHPHHLQRRVCEAPVELTDLTATMLDIAGLDPAAALSRRWPGFNAAIPGRSLLPVVRGEAAGVRDCAWSECRGQWQMVRSPRYTYVRMLNYAEPGGAPELLFDRDADPHERRDLVGDPAHAAALQWHRDRRDFIVDHYHPAQLRWAPSRDDDAPTQP